MLMAISLIVIAFIGSPAGHFMPFVSISGLSKSIFSISLLNLFLLDTIESYLGFSVRKCEI